MGSCHSCGTCCNCFIQDNNIKNRNVIRNESIKWMWSNDHDISLTESLIDIPLDVIHLIKLHSFSTKHDYIISKPTICNAKYYSNTNKLLCKTLCANWYRHKMYSIQTLSISLIGNNMQSQKQILDAFLDHSQSLPALRLEIGSDNTEQQSVRRTIMIDKCAVSVQLGNIDFKDIDSNTIQNTHVFMLILNESDDINTADQLIQTMMDINESFQNKTCVVVRLCDGNLT
eukprot:173409_1